MNLEGQVHGRYTGAHAITLLGSFAPKIKEFKKMEERIKKCDRRGAVRLNEDGVNQF